MSRHLQHLEEMEAGSAERLRPLVDEFAVAYGVVDELLRCLAAAGAEEAEDSDVARFRVALLPRLADDIRGVWLLAARGYAMQAAALAATALESGASLIKVGRSEELALKWLEWKQLDRLPWSVRAACRAVDVGGSSDLGEGLYLWYQVLCQVKHVNPNIQKRVPIAFNPAQHYLNVDPSVSPGIIRRTILALYVPLQMTVVALSSMDGGLLTIPESCGSQEVGRLLEEYQRINREVVPRLGQ